MAQPTSVPPPSASSSSVTPSTSLPSDPTSLRTYIHAQQLSSLRDLFTSKSASIALQSSQDAKARRARRSRQRRRRYSPNNTTTSTLDIDDDSDDENELIAKEGEALESGIDRGHAWELVYDLSPNEGADTYYHGPHPPPPAKIVKALLRASKLSPYFDPNGMSSTQLYEPAERLWEGELRDVDPDEWEMEAIASFSTECTKRKARSTVLQGEGDAKRNRSTSGDRTLAQAVMPQRGQSPFAQPPMDERAYAQAQAQGGPGGPVAASLGQTAPYWKGVYDRW